jgi:hypothetical protein
LYIPPSKGSSLWRHSQTFHLEERSKVYIIPEKKIQKTTKMRENMKEDPGVFVKECQENCLFLH